MMRINRGLSGRDINELRSDLFDHDVHYKIRRFPSVGDFSVRLFFDIRWWDLIQYEYDD